MSDEDQLPKIGLTKEQRMFLEAVLEPFPEAIRDELIRAVDVEVDTRALISMACNEQDTAWHIGQASPTNENRIVYAMLLWENLRTVSIFTFEEVEKEGEPGVLYFREVMFNPKHIEGPISPKALLAELRSYFMGDMEPPAGDTPPKTNGAARAQA